MDIKTITTVLQIALAIVMFGLGLHLTVGDFARVVRYPRAVIIGLIAQSLILPFAAFGLALFFNLPPLLAVGLMLLAASPGGITANLYSHLAKGDVALNITLTAINSVLCLITLPLIVGFSFEYFLNAEQKIPLPTGKIIGVFAVVIVPVALGMLIRHYWPKIAHTFDKPVKLLSLLVLILAIVVSLISEREKVMENVKIVGFSVLAFNIISLSVGFFVPRFFGIDKKQSIAVGMEIGIHNGTLAIAVATTALNNMTIAMPAAIYSILMFFTAALFGYLVNLKKA